MQVEALTDSYSIFSYLAAAHLKLPAEKSTFYHLAYLREKLVTGLISSYNWTDTRDMVADGLTKGSADRSALSAVLDGHYVLNHADHEYREPSSSTSTDRRVSFAQDVCIPEPASSTTAASSSLLCTSGGGGAHGTSPSQVLEGGSHSSTSWFTESIIICGTYSMDYYRLLCTPVFRKKVPTPGKERPDNSNQAHVDSRSSQSV